MAKMDFLKLAREARSCRRFDESMPLSFEDLKWLLDCARLSPSARNAQQLRFITVNQGDTCQQLFSLTRWAGALKEWGGPKPGERPTAFIAVLMPVDGGELLWADTGIACQTIQLAATSKGWGACIIFSFDRAKTPVLLQVPKEYKIALLIGLGVAVEKRVVDNMPPDGSFNYWRDERGVHHVPKRGLNELIINKF